MATRKTTKPNIDNLSLADLEELNRDTQARIKAVREEERLKLRAEFEQRAVESGFSLADVVGGSKGAKSGRKATSKGLSTNHLTI